MKRIMLSTAMLAMSLLGIHANENANKPESWGNTPFVIYPTTKATFFGSGIDLSKDWNICTGSTNGGVEVHLIQQILPIQNCPGEYVVVRTYTTPDGKLLKRSLRRLSDYGSVPV